MPSGRALRCNIVCSRCIANSKKLGDLTAPLRRLHSATSSRGLIVWRASVETDQLATYPCLFSMTIQLWKNASSQWRISGVSYHGLTPIVSRSGL